VDETAKGHRSVRELEGQGVEIPLATVDAGAIRQRRGQSLPNVGLAFEPPSPNAFKLALGVLGVVLCAALREASPAPRLKLGLTAFSRRKLGRRFDLPAPRATKHVGSTETPR
jgi:hypothetical protein